MALAASRDVLDLYRQWEWMVHAYTRHVPSWLEEDAQQAARIGLWKAARTWQPGKSQFQTWAVHRIRWEVSDELRRFDHLGRRDRDMLKEWEQWLHDWNESHEEWPSASDAAEAGFDSARMHRLSARSSYLAWEDLLPSTRSAEDEALTTMLTKAVMDALVTLQFPLWQAASLRWFDDWGPAKIAAYVGVSEATVYHRIRQARQRLFG